jgi:hypothetical protein
MKNTKLVQEPCLPDKLRCEQIIAASNGMDAFTGVLVHDEYKQMLCAEEPGLPVFPQFLAEIPDSL